MATTGFGWGYNSNGVYLHSDPVASIHIESILSIRSCFATWALPSWHGVRRGSGWGGLQLWSWRIQYMIVSCMSSRKQSCGMSGVANCIIWIWQAVVKSGEDLLGLVIARRLFLSWWQECPGELQEKLIFYENTNLSCQEMESWPLKHTICP